MMLGGMDTTSGFTGNVLLRLCKDPELRAKFNADPEPGQEVTDELLRLFTPTLGLGAHRFAGRRVPRPADVPRRPGDPDVGGGQPRPGDVRDPDKLDLSRANAKKQMAFGVGMHRCLGSHYAKLMFEVMVTQVFERLPDFALAGDTEAVRGRRRGVRGAQAADHIHARPARGLTAGRTGDTR